MLRSLFALEKHGTTFSREVLGGLTTFAAMAYILAVNPAILASTGMDKGALVTATAVASAVMTLLMALATNYPIALAPGMGLNAFFAFTICGAGGVPWPAALGLVFYSGLFFLLLSVTGLRLKVVNAIPHELKLAITAGIGFFIAFIGLQNAGVVVSNPQTLVTLGDLSKPGPLLALAGVVVTAILVVRKVPGAIILGMVAITVAGLFLPGTEGGAITRRPEAFLQWPASLGPTFLKLDLGYLWTHFAQVSHLVAVLLFLSIFDAMGTLIGVGQRAGLLDENGNLPKIGRAFMADAGASIFGALIGTSTVTAYVESATGVEAGGRTGLTAVVAALAFLLALFLTPLILIIPPVATAPALILVGVLMIQGLAEVKLDDFATALPVFVTVLMIPLSFSISEGLAFGLVAHVGMKAGSGRHREVGPVAYGLCALFVLHFLFGR